MSPIKYSDLNDDRLDNFEKAMCQNFGDETWYSVCLYVTEDVTLEEAKFYIGAKVDEKKLLRPLLLHLKMNF